MGRLTTRPSAVIFNWQGPGTSGFHNLVRYLCIRRRLPTYPRSTPHVHPHRTPSCQDPIGQAFSSLSSGLLRYDGRSLSDFDLGADALGRILSSRQSTAERERKDAHVLGLVRAKLLAFELPGRLTGVELAANRPARGGVLPERERLRTSFKCLSHQKPLSQGARSV